MTKKSQSFKFDKQDLVPAYQVLSEKGGYNAEILYIAYPDGRMEVTARYGAKKGGFTYYEALEKYRDLVQYQEELVARHIPLPRIEKIVIEYDHSAEKAVVLKTSPWTGKDVHCLLQGMDASKDKRKMRELVIKICRTLKPVLDDRLAGWETKVGIDPRCSNFTLDDKGKMWFVDLFPPRYRRQGQPIIEWPEPKNELGRRLGYFKHYDVRGIILCTVAQLARVKPRLKCEFEKWVFDFLKSGLSKNEVEEYEQMMKKTVWYRFRESMKKNDVKTSRCLIENADKEKVCDIEYNVYALRELALELAASGRMSMEELDLFFKESHFEDLLPNATILALKKRLIKCIN